MTTAEMATYAYDQIDQARAELDEPEASSADFGFSGPAETAAAVRSATRKPVE
ncbi:hypothetical protein ACFYXQ_02020 [Nocardia jiangxiensis]|uniref:Uncharacterized protein n=1 Tax=Nocardia jiangxiensis TaxID=282685 RepID=A0ABW6RU69_9NOCA